MRSKILSRKKSLKIILIGFTISLVFLFYFISINSIQSSSPEIVKNIITLSKQKQVIPALSASPVGEPARLKIPKIKVDITLESVGLTSQGAVGVPKGHTNAAWYDLGPRPGEIGNAVITGHYGIWKNGQPTVFNNLYKLRGGDKLFIEDDKGMIISFVVRESKLYAPKANAPEVFILNDGKAHLNLITCEGAWNKVTQSYPKRLVVFTDRENYP